MPPGLYTALEATQGQVDGFFSQLPYICHLEESKRWHLWEIDLGFALNLTPGWSAGSPRPVSARGKRGSAPQIQHCVQHYVRVATQIQHCARVSTLQASSVPTEPEHPRRCTAVRSRCEQVICDFLALPHSG